jgi:hypothetical protein
VDSVIFDGGRAGAFADGCVWAQMGAIGVAATLLSVIPKVRRLARPGPVCIQVQGGVP